MSIPQPRRIYAFVGDEQLIDVFEPAKANERGRGLR
jgi:hypothetical protein